MVIIASGIARGRLRPTTRMATTAESRKMAAILQLMGLERQAALVRIAYFFGIGHPFHGQLTAVKTRYPLTRIR